MAGTPRGGAIEDECSREGLRPRQPGYISVSSPSSANVHSAFGVEGCRTAVKRDGTSVPPVLMPEDSSESRHNNPPLVLATGRSIHLGYRSFG